jgi:anaerobic selenocysteine-containing dehydrogenase
MTGSRDTSAEAQVIHRRTVCPHDCPDTCAMQVVVEGDRAVAVRGDREHAYTRGFLCHKVARYQDRVYHAERVLYPQRRVGPKGSGRFERVSWETALDEIAARFHEIAAGPHGPQAILPYSYAGTYGKIQGSSLDRRFFHRLGASLLDRTICATAGGAGYTYTIGGRVGLTPEAFAVSRYIINWGSNTAVTNSHLWATMVESRKQGAKLVCIDPYRSRTAERCDWHLAPKPGTDAALALGMMHVLFRDGLVDRDYIASYCLGGEELEARVREEYGLDRVSQITGLPAHEIETLAHEYGETSPAAIRVNYGMQRHAGGGMAMRTITCLPALIGAWRQFGGGIMLSTSGMYPFNVAGLERPDLSPVGTRVVNMTRLAEALHGELPGPPVAAMYVYNSNPAAVCPDQKRVLSGLARDDLFLVVHEQFPTDTADYADLLLPATMQLEHVDLHGSFGHVDVQINLPAIPPVGEAKPNTQVFRELAERLGFERELFQVSDLDLARVALWEGQTQRPPQLEGITVDTLTERGPQRLRLPERYTPFAEGNFPTPSGRCEFHCARLEQLGFDPLPTYLPPAESADSDPELAARFPLQMVSPPSPNFLNSTFVNIDHLRASAREPEVELHPDDASLREIQHGDPVRVFNDRGAFEARAVVRPGEIPSVRPGVVMSPGIWWAKYARDKVNVNVTTSTRLTDMGGGATFFDNLVEVERL